MTPATRSALRSDLRRLTGSLQFARSAPSTSAFEASLCRWAMAVVALVSRRLGVEE